MKHIWNGIKSIFVNDAHNIISERGKEILAEQQSQREMKQTAVDWLVQELSKKGDYGLGFYLEHKDEIIQAKAMEKQQIEEAFNQGYRDGESDASNPTNVSIDVSEFANAEEYYNETFKGNESNHYTRFTNEGKLLKY
jgi:hypothetical protein